MIVVVVTIQSKNFEALKLFEDCVSKIMKKHDANMIYAFETQNRNEEIHIIEFPSTMHLENYKTDKEHEKYLTLKNNAIENIDIRVSTQFKNYGLD